MTKRDFFILLIKVFGLFSAVTTLFSVLPSNISLAMLDLDAFSILWIISAILVVVGLFVALIFKADKVVRLLKLDKGFDSDQIEIGHLKGIDIIKLGTFIISGLSIIDNIPTFLSHSLFAFKGNTIGLEYNTEDKFYWAVSGLNLLIGFLLLTNYEIVANKIKPKK
jgi:hypothetical protein